MEIDALRAVSYITGPLSPGAEQAVARAKNLAQRVLPGDKAGEDTAYAHEHKEKTGITLQVDPSANLVIARVVDNETGELIRQFPSKAAVRFVTASRELLKYDEDAKLSDLELANISTTNVTV